MDSSAFFLSTVAAAIGLFTLFRNLKLHREDNEENDNSASSSSSPQSALSLSSPSSSLNRNWTHHVFPSFRGEDVRRDFLSHIQAEFQRKGITPFIDNEIKRGDSIGPELIRAIKGSKIAIILLSRNYASSSWCLDELAEIMKCREELGQTVMVVFYKVDPSDVKKLNGEFGEVFRKTCDGKSKEDIRRWRQALAEVATIAGYHSNNWDNEAAMINKIATDISNKLNNSSPSRDFDGFVGMRGHLENMKELLCLDSDEVRMVGIWGPSGIGKTTIARVVYNELCNSFQMSVFMESIEEKYTRPCSDDYSAKLLLQQQFMSKITNESDMKISHLGVVEDRLKDKKVLVVLDGVDQSMQLDAMAKETWWFGSGSRIIITTQSLNLFREHRINQIYKVDFPPNGEALQMLCMYAFRQKSPIDGFKKLAWEVTSLAGNLPLGLRVMGSYLRGMSKQEWTKAITRLRNSLDTKIQSILKLSYDALDDQDKDLFLHIACFFNHEEVEKVEAHLADSFEDGIGLNVLTEKSLISMESGPRWSPGRYIRMHNLLAQLGKEIVHKQHIREPGQRLYLTDPREFSELLKDDAGNKSVIGIDVDFQSIEEICQKNERAFEGMCNLQFLRFRDFSKEMNSRLHLPRGLDYIFQNLRLLQWWHCPMTCLPSFFKTDFLVLLKMPKSKLKKLWEGTKPLQNLKWLDLSGSEKLRELPDLSTATNLQELSLRECPSLINLPSSIGNATNLQKLDLSYCSSFSNLPSSIGNATNLRILNLSHCSSFINLPSSIGNATNLQILKLSYCSSLINLPSSIGNATNLQELDLRYCLSLINLPSSIGNATNLQKLDLSYSSLINLPSSIGNATNLQALDLSHCSSLINLPSSIGNATNLQRLNLSYCSSLINLPSSIGNTTNLQVLILSDCSSLINLPSSIGNATNLQALDLRDCSSLINLPSSIGNATNLKRLNLSYCSSLINLPSSIGNATNLQKLDLGYCSSLINLPSSIGNVTNLQKLDLRHCSSLINLPSSIGNATNLQEVDLSDCSSLINLPSSIGNATHLQVLDLSYCSSLINLPSSIGNATNLKKLYFRHCSSLINLPSSIGNATNLQELDLRCCSSLINLPSSIGNATNLQILDLSYCSSLVELSFPIGNLHKLQRLEIKGCAKLEVLSININLESLHMLDLTDCLLLERFPEIPTNISVLNLQGTAIKEVPASIKSCFRLYDLELRGCRKLVSLPQLPDSIVYINATNCESLERLDCSFQNKDIRLYFKNCFKLNQEAKDLIIQAPSSYAILPGTEVPAYCTHRAKGGSLRIKLNEMLLPTSMTFKACVLLVYDGYIEDHDCYGEEYFYVTWNEKIQYLNPLLSEHLYIFNVAADVISSEVVFDFKLGFLSMIEGETISWKIGECGVVQLYEVPL